MCSPRPRISNGSRGVSLLSANLAKLRDCAKDCTSYSVFFYSSVTADQVDREGPCQLVEDR